jgi:hypothetical protein
MSIRSNKKAKGIDMTPLIAPTLVGKPSGLLVARKHQSLQSPHIRAEDSSFTISIPDELATLASCSEDNLLESDLDDDDNIISSLAQQQPIMALNMTALGGLDTKQMLQTPKSLSKVSFN